MDGRDNEYRRQDNGIELPPLIDLAFSHQVAGFDIADGNISSTYPPQSHGYPFLGSKTNSGWNTAAQPKGNHRVHSVSISMPPSPIGQHLPSAERVLFNDFRETLHVEDIPDASPVSEPATTVHAKYYSQPIPRHLNYAEAPYMYSPYRGTALRNPRSTRFSDTRYDSFKTRASIIDRQLSRFCGKPVEPEPSEPRNSVENEALTADRYFDALEGPELETLRPSEELVLPDDSLWPFLLRYPISSFGICLGTSSQAILWKNVATSLSTEFLHVSLAVNYALWCISIACIALVVSIYLLKMIIYFEAIRREYYHPVRVNFFFAPWIALLFLTMGVPPSISTTLPQAL